MHDENVRSHLVDELLESGVVNQEGSTLSYFFGGREYLVLLTVVDVTDWEKEV